MSDIWNRIVSPEVNPHSHSVQLCRTQRQQYNITQPALEATTTSPQELVPRMKYICHPDLGQWYQEEIGFNVWGHICGQRESHWEIGINCSSPEDVARVPRRLGWPCQDSLLLLVVVHSILGQLSLLEGLYWFESCLTRASHPSILILLSFNPLEPHEFTYSTSICCIFVPL